MQNNFIPAFVIEKAKAGIHTFRIRLKACPSYSSETIGIKNYETNNGNKTRRAYYVANITGLIIMIALITECIFLSVDDGRMEFKSVSFGIALLLMFMVPFALISIYQR